ncbi:MAG: hypothetical protein Q9226_008616, partial [Calogaya cf. arnoldii]
NNDSFCDRDQSHEKAYSPRVGERAVETPVSTYERGHNGDMMHAARSTSNHLGRNWGFEENLFAPSEDNRNRPIARFINLLTGARK